MRWRLRLGLWTLVGALAVVVGVVTMPSPQNVSSFHCGTFRGPRWLRERLGPVLHGSVERWASRQVGRPVRIGALGGGLRVGLVLRDVKIGAGATGDWTAAVDEVVVTPGVWRWVRPLPRAAYRVHLQSPVVRWLNGNIRTASASTTRGLGRPDLDISVNDGYLLIGDDPEIQPLIQQASGLVQWRRDRVRIVRAQGRVADVWQSFAGEYEVTTRRWHGRAEAVVAALDGQVVVEATGEGERGRLTGHVEIGELALAAHGSVDGARRRVHASLRRLDPPAPLAGATSEDAVQITAWLSASGRMVTRIRIDDLSLHEHRIAGRLLATGRRRAARAEWRGTVLIHGAVIDEAPVAPIRARLHWRPDRCLVRELSVGRRFRSAARVGLTAPYHLRGRAVLDRIGLGDVAGLSRLRLRDEAAGRLTGTLALDGTLPVPWVLGALRAADVAIGPMRYQSAHLQFQGPWPIVRFHDSTLVSQGGSALRVEGHLDLRDLGTPTVFRDIDVVTAQGSTVWQGWDIAQHAGEADQLAISRRMADDWTIGFRTFVNDERQGKARPSDDEVELRYQLSEHQNVKLGVTRQEEFMGVEHRWQF